jgi:hypothetical protein
MFGNGCASNKGVEICNYWFVSLFFVLFQLKMAKLDGMGKRIISLGDQSQAIGVWKLNTKYVYVIIPEL